jgi:serine/threonine-protein kinase
MVFQDGTRLATLSMADSSVASVVETAFDERMPDLSPDGRWLTYVSNETGEREVYVQPFPGPGGKRRISTEGGREPAWSRDGRKLAYLSRRTTPEGRIVDRMMEVDVTLGETFRSGPPRVLFELDTSHYAGTEAGRGWDMTANADRFLFVHETYPAGRAELDRVHIIDNWFEELQRRAPATR